MQFCCHQRDYADAKAAVACGRYIVGRLDIFANEE